MGKILYFALHEIADLPPLVYCHFSALPGLVHVYWLRYAEQGQKRELNFLERTVAYGVKCTPKGAQYTMHFVASKSKWADVFLDETGKAGLS